jgi:hypothetical protein
MTLITGQEEKNCFTACSEEDVNSGRCDCVNRVNSSILNQPSIPAKVAVFCRYEREFRELEMTPAKRFKRIRTINDIRGNKFNGIIRVYDWHRGGKEMLEAYDYLRIRHPELFD